MLVLPPAIKMHPAWVGIREPVKDVVRAGAARLGLSPIQAMCREMERQGFPLRAARALEVFGGDGSLHTRRYASRVANLEVWECNARHAASLRRNLPNATIKIVDSYEEIERTRGRFDFVWIDNPEVVHGPHGAHCEHFDLLPHVFRVLADQAVIVLCIMPRLDSATRRRYPYLWSPRCNDMNSHLARRAQFYGTDTPEHVTLAQMHAVYTRLAQEHGYEMLWAVTRRISFYGYVAYGVRRGEDHGVRRGEDHGVRRGKERCP